MMRAKHYKSPVATIVSFCFLFSVLCFLYGCEAFVRKFTRKPKEIKMEEPVIQPEEYPNVTVTKEQLYKDYFLFWQTWSDELLSVLSENANFKKQKECGYEALDNLIKIEALLKEEKAKALEPFVEEFKTVKDIVFAGHLTSSDFYYLKTKIERIKSKVHHEFSFSVIQKDIK